MYKTLQFTSLAIHVQNPTVYIPSYQCTKPCSYMPLYICTKVMMHVFFMKNLFQPLPAAKLLNESELMKVENDRYSPLSLEAVLLDKRQLHPKYPRF